MAAKLKKGDFVIVLAGKDKGKTGVISQVFPAESKALVEGINVYFKHMKPSKDQEGGKITKSLPIHLSNLAICKNGKAEKVAFSIAQDGSKIRVSKRTGEPLDA